MKYYGKNRFPNLVNWLNSDGNHLHHHSITMPADYFLVTVILGLKLQYNCLASISPKIPFSISIFPILLNHNVTSQPGSEQHWHSGLCSNRAHKSLVPKFCSLSFSYKSNARHPRFYGFRVQGSLQFPLEHSLVFLIIAPMTHHACAIC